MFSLWWNSVARCVSTRFAGCLCQCYWTSVRNGSPVGLVHWQSRPEARHDWKLLLQARLIASACVAIKTSYREQVRLRTMSGQGR